MSRRRATSPNQLDLLALLEEPRAETEPAATDGTPPCWCGHARAAHAPHDASRPSWGACQHCPCLGHHGVPGLGVAHAGRHELWAWHLVYALDGRRDELMYARLGGGGGSCDGCGGWDYDSRGVTLGSWSGGRAEPVRYTFGAVLSELDRRAAARPDLVARVLALGTEGYDVRRQILADELWGCAA